MTKQYSVREFKILLRSNGYDYIRSSGDHDIYSNGKLKISIPVASKEVNKMLARRLIKENKLTERR